MSRFHIQHAPEWHQISHEISNKYFTLDTADLYTVESWIRKNPHYLTYAYDGDRLAGFVGILPLTTECGQLLERNELLEEDVTADCILGPEAMQYAQYLYISAIAVENVDRFRDKRVAAALVSCAAGMIRHLYRQDYLKKIFANPTTFWGHRMIKRFDLTKVTGFKRAMRAGNDIYAAEINPDYQKLLQALELRYQRFILDYPWPLD